MGDLFVLPRSEAPARAVVAGRSAEILFFTGVRYYRMEDAVITTPVKRRRRSKKTADLVRAELHG